MTSIKGVLGRAVAHVWTTEFQKRGLPLVHLIIFLHLDSKLSIPEEIDSLLSAEFPDEDEQSELFELVKQFMVHTPCDAPNSNAPCLRNGKCSKTFLSPLEIIPQSMRTHMPISGEETLARSIKSEVRRLITDGLFLFHHTGFGSLGVISTWNVSFQSGASSIYTNMSTRAMEFGRCQDEVKLYLDSCYVSGCEEIWRTCSSGQKHHSGSY